MTAVMQILNTDIVFVWGFLRPEKILVTVCHSMDTIALSETHLKHSIPEINIYKNLQFSIFYIFFNR